MKSTPKNDSQEGVRLNKYIANAGICSRRKADEYIEQGLVQVNGKVVNQMGYKVTENDVVTYLNKKVVSQKKYYILLNKPKDFITTTHDPQGRKTVMDLIKNACNERVFPIGRLDRNTTGLLLFTNDGDITQTLSHPSSEVKKIYQVELDKPLKQQDFLTIKKGITLEEGLAKVDDIAYVDNTDLKKIGVELHIGWNRVVRRIFESLQYEVKKLDRVMFAGLTKKDLPRGKWRHLRKEELIYLKYFPKKIRNS